MFCLCMILLNTTVFATKLFEFLTKSIIVLNNIYRCFDISENNRIHLYFVELLYGHCVLPKTFQYVRVFLDVIFE